MSTEIEQGTRLQGKHLALARIVWAVLTATILAAYAMVTIANLTAPVTICDGGNCTMSLAQAAAWRAAGFAPELGNLLSQVFSVGVPLGFVVIAGLIVWRRSDDWLALLVSFSLIALGSYLLSGINLPLSTRPGWNLLSQVLLALTCWAFTSLFYLFPNGRFVPRWTRYMFAAFVAVWVVGLAFTTAEIFQGTYLGGRDSSPIAIIEIALTLVMWLLGIAAQVIRYIRVSDPVQRQQTKWVLLGLGGPIFTVVFWLVIISQSDAFLAITLLLIPPMLLFALAWPASMGIAILRYRLWDIDIIVRRTLVYSTLTLLLALFYFGSVVVLQQILRALTGQTSNIAIIVSTLAIAALFNPLRQRVQYMIDRQFYRRKYDAQKVLAEFGATARDEVDLQRLTEELLVVGEETMEPTHQSLWLTPVQDHRENKV